MVFIRGSNIKYNIVTINPNLKERKYSKIVHKSLAKTKLDYNIK